MRDIQLRQIALENYRCFHERQVARLAPLTLLVGENSAGKTSFLAMLRPLWDSVYGTQVPDFKEDPFDLGSFDEIAHFRGGRLGRADWFRAELMDNHDLHAKITYGERGTSPEPVRAHYSKGDITFMLQAEPAGIILKVGTEKGEWKRQISGNDRNGDPSLAGLTQTRIFAILDQMMFGGDRFEPIGRSPSFERQDKMQISDLVQTVNFIPPTNRPLASAPVRSRPRRTYDPDSFIPDPEGDYANMLLANLVTREPTKWDRLKNRLQDFGKDAELFDEVSIKRLGQKSSGPFQVQVRKFGSKHKGPPRNLLDVGYGVSQVLPVVTELLRSDPASIFLMQQPEVHLHPVAQAALGSLFCRVAGANRQLLIETHSDYIMDRIRADIRDGKSQLKPDDVSILFFERDGLDGRIHSLRVDKQGNIKNEPVGYRKFVMKETTRVLGF